LTSGAVPPAPGA